MKLSEQTNRLLITGASGFLGWHVCRQALKNVTVYGIYLTHPTHLKKVRSSRIDFTDRRLFEKTFRGIKPHAVVHIGGATDPNWCQENPEPSELMNVTVTSRIAEWCAESKIPMVFTSSDLVFRVKGRPLKGVSTEKTPHRKEN